MTIRQLSFLIIKGNKLELGIKLRVTRSKRNAVLQLTQYKTLSCRPFEIRHHLSCKQ